MKYYYGSDLHIPCIYKIFNTHTKRVYIGQTITLKKRWVSGHSLRLKNNNHFNIILQNDFNKCYKVLGHTDFLEFPEITRGAAQHLCLPPPPRALSACTTLTGVDGRDTIVG